MAWRTNAIKGDHSHGSVTICREVTEREGREQDLSSWSNFEEREREMAKKKSQQDLHQFLVATIILAASVALALANSSNAVALDPAEPEWNSITGRGNEI